MLMPIMALIIGLAVLVWSADKFVDGAANTSKVLGVPPLVIGMIVIGFGTSAPEMVVSVFASAQGNPGLALGNAFGSNITNIALVLGISALLLPMTVSSGVLRRELPMLLGVTLLAGYQLLDGVVSRLDAVILLVVFVAVLFWTIRQNGGTEDKFAADTSQAHLSAQVPLKMSIIWLVIGLICLILSSRLLVWGAVEVATSLGVDDLIIGLTIVALGTSLPELAAAIVSIRRKEHDLALGNLIGSNLFNTLAVVGLAGLVRPITVASEVLSRDWLLMLTLTLLLTAFAWRPKSWQGVRAARINRLEGGVFVAIYVSYISWLIMGVVLS